jgi:hypothetical protein
MPAVTPGTRYCGAGRVSAAGSETAGAPSPRGRPLRRGPGDAPGGTPSGTGRPPRSAPGAPGARAVAATLRKDGSFASAARGARIAACRRKGQPVAPQPFCRTFPAPALRYSRSTRNFRAPGRRKTTRRARITTKKKVPASATGLIPDSAAPRPTQDLRSATRAGYRHQPVPSRQAPHRPAAPLTGSPSSATVITRPRRPPHLDPRNRPPPALTRPDHVTRRLPAPRPAPRQPVPGPRRPPAAVYRGRHPAPIGSRDLNAHSQKGRLRSRRVPATFRVAVPNGRA